MKVDFKEENLGFIWLSKIFFIFLNMKFINKNKNRQIFSILLYPVSFYVYLKILHYCICPDDIHLSFSVLQYNYTTLHMNPCLICTWVSQDFCSTTKNMHSLSSWNCTNLAVFKRGWIIILWNILSFSVSHSSCRPLPTCLPFFKLE